MITLFAGLSKLLRYRRLHIDGLVFRINSTLTVLLLLAFCITNSTKQLVGEPIGCQVDHNVVDQQMLNSWCYTQNITSLDEKHYHFNWKVYPGVAKEELKSEDHFRRKTYYQWIWTMLLLQAICFYFPRWLWKSFEGNRISDLVSDLNFFSVDCEEKSVKKINLIVDYFQRTQGLNDFYAIKYFFCEFLSFCNIFLQICLTDFFIGGGFYTFGADWLRFMSFDPTIRTDPLITIFPILAKCQFPRFGASGSPEYIDSLCVLSINIFNQKIYLFLWFWYYFLAVITSFVIIFRLFIICCPLIRYYVSRYRFDLSHNRVKQNKHLVVNQLFLGDWFLLYLLGQNIEPIIFGDILINLCEKLETNAKLSANIYSIKSEVIGNESSKM